MSWKSGVTVAGLTMLLLSYPLGQSQSPNFRMADIILSGGKIITVDRDFSIGEAIAIEAGRFLAVGSNAEISRLQGPSTRLIDLKGQTVLPGLIDTHLHQLNAGSSLGKVDLYTARSLQEFQQRIAERVRSTPPGEWVIASGRWFETNLKENRLPTRYDLDPVSPENPVRIERGHASIFNSYALSLAHIDKDSEPPEGGEIRKDPESGEPNGILLDRAVYHYFGDLLPSPSEEERLQGLVDIQKELHATGLTGVIDPALRPDEIRLYQRALAEGKLSMRTGLMLRVDPTRPLEEIETMLKAFGLRDRAGDERLWLHAIKMGIDGGPHNAYLRDEYANHPGYRGLQIVSTEKLKKVVSLLNRLDWRVGIHCVGDAAIDSILDAYEYAHQQKSIIGKRWELIHAILPAEDHYPRIQKLQLNVTTQTMHNWSLGANFVNNFGKDRANQTQPTRRWLDELGIRVSGGTDGGTFPFDQMLLLWMELSRETEGAGVLAPEQAITREEAIRFHTINGAYASFDENRRGSIEPGKLADLVVLSGDILTVPVEQIRHLRVQMTMVGGTIVYQADDQK